MNGKRIAVYYIATGKYKTLFSDFLESVQNLYPKCIKIVKLISDGLYEYKDYKKGNVVVDLCPRVSDYPWPVVALYKMWHIIDNFDESCDYVCYFNSNSIINEHDDIFNLNKLTVSYHSFNKKDHPYNPWGPVSIDINSSAYLPNETYEYIQSGFFFGPKDIVYKMCNDILDMIRYDTRRCMFAQWHDESYLNKWCVDNSSLVDKKYIMTVYKEDIDKERFIYLRDKRDYNILKK